MKNKVIIKVLLIIIIIQSILPIKVMALEQNFEIVLDEQKTETGTSAKSIFDSNITYSWAFIHAKDKGYPWNYVLLTPSTVNDFSELPVIVWLHGSYEAKQDEGKSIATSGLPGILLNDEYKYERVSAYIVCPQITDPRGQWGGEQMKEFLNNFKKDYNVDTDNIIITGESLGGNSAVILAAGMPDYFSKAVIFSAGYALKISIPAIWYVGMSEPEYYRNAAISFDDCNKGAVCWAGWLHTATYAAYELDDGKFVRYC